MKWSLVEGQVRREGSSLNLATLKALGLSGRQRGPGLSGREQQAEQQGLVSSSGLSAGIEKGQETQLVRAACHLKGDSRTALAQDARSGHFPAPSCPRALLCHA